MKKPKEMPDATNIGPNAFDGRNGSRRDTSNRLHIGQDTNFSEVLQRVEGVSCQGGNQVTALCAAHEDHNPSLSICGESDRLFLYCNAGCTIEDVTAAIGLTLADLYHTDRLSSEQIRRIVNRKPRREHPKPSRLVLREYDVTDVDSWDFQDETGKVVATKIRTNYMVEYDDGTIEAKKTFRVEPKGVDLPLYLLPAVLSAVRQGWPLFLAEGEAKADRLNDLIDWTWGIPGLATSYGGLSKHGRKQLLDLGPSVSKIVIVPDRDEPGRKQCDRLVSELQGVGAHESVSVLDFDRLAKHTEGRV